MRSALRHLRTHGISALRPQKINNKWRKPLVSPRIAADLRKRAILSGSYGSFNVETGVGWDPLWDSPKAKAQPVPTQDVGEKLMSMEQEEERGGNYGGIQLTLLRPPKETKRVRTREARAQKIESLVKGMDKKIEEFREEKMAKKPPPGIEEEFKKMVKGARY